MVGTVELGGGDDVLLPYVLPRHDDDPSLTSPLPYDATGLTFVLSEFFTHVVFLSPSATKRMCAAGPLLVSNTVAVGLYELVLIVVLISTLLRRRRTQYVVKDRWWVEQEFNLHYGGGLRTAIGHFVGPTHKVWWARFPAGYA